MASKLRLVKGVGIVLVSCAHMTTWGEEISCRAMKKGVDHVARIVVLDGKVQRFFYGSMARNGHTCEVIGERGKAGATWVDEADNKELVSLSLDDEVTKVSLQNSDPDFFIKILTPLAPVCGVNGYIARSIVITKGKKRCTLQD